MLQQISRFRTDPRKQRKLIPSTISRYTVTQCVKRPTRGQPPNKGQYRPNISQSVLYSEVPLLLIQYHSNFFDSVSKIVFGRQFGHEPG